MGKTRPAFGGMAAPPSDFHHHTGRPRRLLERLRQRNFPEACPGRILPGPPGQILEQPCRRLPSQIRPGSLPPEQGRTVSLRGKKNQGRKRHRTRRASSGEESQYYRVLQKLGFEGEDEREQREKLFDRAIAYEPAYREYYFSQALYLRFHGEPGDWEAFALSLTDPKNPGDLVRYAWLVCHLCVSAAL